MILRSTGFAVGQAVLAEGVGGRTSGCKGNNMTVRLRIQFEPTTEEDWWAMRSLANSLTDDRKG